MGEEDPENDKTAEKAEEKAAGAADQSAELKDRLLRLAAEFDNYKKRIAKSLESSNDAGRLEVISKLLPTVDEFELALNAFGKEGEHLKGIALIFSNLMSTLKSFGLKEIDAVGKFDPYKHETVLTRDSDKPDGEILEVVRKGYMLNNVMIRPASVIISRKENANSRKENANSKEENNEENGSKNK